MKIISVGPDEHDPYPEDMPENAVWVVYAYESGDYCGSGDAYCCAAGKFYNKALGHCSCYGAWDTSWSEITRDEMLNMHLVGDDEKSQKLRAAALECLAGQPQ